MRGKKNKLVSLISIISIVGVAVGVMALIVVLAVMSGFDRELKSKIVGISPHLLVNRVGGIESVEEVTEKVYSLGDERIRSVTGFVEGQAIVSSEANATGVILKGIDSGSADFGQISEYLTAENLAVFQIKETEDDKRPGIIIGSGLAQILRVEMGDEVSVISPVMEKSGLFGKRPKTVDFRVAGIFQMGMNQYDTGLAFVNTAQARNLYGLGDKLSGVSIRLADVDDAQELRPAVQGVLGYPYWVRSWMDMNRNFFSALKVEKTVMTILLLLIILVAAFNIISTLIMVVTEKTKDIGIMRALGARARSVRKIFLFEGFIVGLFGVILGSVAGLFLAANLNPVADFVESVSGIEIFPKDIYYFSTIPTEINVPDVALVIVFALLASVFAGWYPATKAARLDPVEAIRYE